MAKINFSVVVTILNEADSISGLISSLINQTYPANEIIFVDAGSTDRTLIIIGQAQASSKIPIRVINYPGSNRSQARNKGILEAASQYIAVTDAGCEADKNWLMQLSGEFKGDTEVVAGFYLPKNNKPIDQTFSMFTCVSPAKFDPKSFLPSSRSVAFSKKVWQQVGGYPENLNTCEDLVFAKKLFDTGKMKATKKALVNWQQASSYKDFFWQIASYSKGDVEARYWPHIIRISTVWLRYILFVWCPWLLFVYAAFILRKQLSVKIIGVQLLSDFAVMTGSVLGLFSNQSKPENNFKGKNNDS